MGCQGSKESLPARKAVPVAASFDHSLLVTYSKGSPNSKYASERLLGKGAFGTVTLVEHRVTHQKRAMKELSKSGLTHEDKSNMMREVSVLSKLDLPNIMKIYEVIESPSAFHIITEFIPGGELLEIICREKKLSEKLAARFMYDIMTAISYFHSHGIVHRDLKPQNLMLTSSDSSGTVKVIDFGLSGLTSAGSYDEKCDVWSAGVIFYMMITGLVPFYGQDLSQLRRAVCTQVVDFKKPVWDSVSNEAKHLVGLMLEKNPHKRPSAKDVLKHAWFKNYEANKLSDLVISQEALEQLSVYHAEDKLKRTVFTFIATNMLDEENSRDLAQLFRTIDKNEDGKLSKDEIEAAYEHLGISVQDFEKVFAEVDSNSSGMIEYTEFITACFKVKGNEHKDYLAKAFEVYDVGGDGTLSIAELKSGVPGIESTKWNEFLLEADKDQDGKINLNEFKQYLVGEMS